MTESKLIGVIDGILDRNVTIGGKVLFAGEKVKLHLAKFHQGDTVTYTMDRKQKGTIDTMFMAAVPASRVGQAAPGQKPGNPIEGGTPSPAAPQGQATTPPTGKAAPAAAPAKQPAQYPPEEQDLLDARECCLKAAVDLLKGQPSIIVLYRMDQRDAVLEMAAEFERWIRTGEMPPVLSFTSGGDEPGENEP